MDDPTTEELKRFHQWFAVACNNRGWSLAEKDARSGEEDREMLYAAYAAAFHWSQIGRPIHAARAEMLLAHAHALLRHGDLAVQYARRCIKGCRSEEAETWDLAFAHVVCAHAHAVAGDSDQAQEHYGNARERGAAIEATGDRDLFQQEWLRIGKVAGLE